MAAVKPILTALLTLGLLGLSLQSYGQEKEKPKYTIKEVMNRAHKGGLVKKVVDGKANKQEKDELLALYVALNQNKPPKGDPKKWDEMTMAIVNATKDFLAGKEGAKQELIKAVRCAQCHQPVPPR